MIEGPMLFKLEGTQRSFSAKVWVQRDMDYLSRLKVLKLYSIERKIKR